VSEPAWIVLDLRLMSGRQADIAPAWHALVAALSEPPHRVLSSSLSVEQGLVYATTADRGAFLEAARRKAPVDGVGSFGALVCDTDPRHTDTAPERVRLPTARSAWAPYDAAMAAELAGDPRGAVDPPPPAFAALRRVAPAELTPLVAEAEAALTRVRDALR
jgi:hypothetical protein